MILNSLTIVTPIPSPYNVELFDAIAATGRHRLQLLYAAPSFPDRQWNVPAINHNHSFLNEMTITEIETAILSNDLAIFSGYNYQKFGKLISKRNHSGKPWVFWGERLGFLIPTWLGRIYRKLAFPELHRSKAPIWGIGSWAVEGYRSEFGTDRRYFNIPYFSDLNPYLLIERNRSASSPCRFMFSGSFVRRKGVDLVASAFVELIRRGHDAELYLLGDGPMKYSLQTKTSEIANRVHFLGFRQWNELSSYYAQADILCAPSRYDGWGMIVPEGLAAGMPVISTERTGAARELITKDCGWIIPADDKNALLQAMIEAVMLPITERKAMSDRARLVSQTQNLKAGVQRFSEAVEASLLAWNI